MRNKYSGACYKCGLIVHPRTGYFERSGGKWRVQHAACCLIDKQAKGAKLNKKAQKEIDLYKQEYGDAHE